MASDRNPALEALFVQAREEAIDDDFTGRVMSRVETLRRRAIIGWAGVGAAMLIAVWLMAGPLTNAASLTAQLLPQSLIELDDRVVARFLAPVNSISGALGLGFLALRLAYKKIFK